MVSDMQGMWHYQLTLRGHVTVQEILLSATLNWGKVSFRFYPGPEEIIIFSCPGGNDAIDS